MKKIVCLLGLIFIISNSFAQFQNVTGTAQKNNATGKFRWNFGANGVLYPATIDDLAQHYTKPELDALLSNKASLAGGNYFIGLQTFNATNNNEQVYLGSYGLDVVSPTYSAPDNLPVTASVRSNFIGVNDDKDNGVKFFGDRGNIPHILYLRKYGSSFYGLKVGVETLTGDRDLLFPNKSGTLATLGDINGKAGLATDNAFTGNNSFSQTILGLNGLVSTDISAQNITASTSLGGGELSVTGDATVGGQLQVSQVLVDNNVEAQGNIQGTTLITYRNDIEKAVLVDVDDTQVNSNVNVIWPKSNGQLALKTDIPSITGKEDIVNKATNLTSPDNLKYPTTLAVANGLSDKASLSTDNAFAGNNTVAGRLAVGTTSTTAGIVNILGPNATSGNAVQVLNVVGGNGANSSAAGFASGTIGSNISIKGGNGGSATGTGSNFGGNGGTISILAGDGGFANSGTSNFSGIGGGAVFQAGSTTGNNGGGNAEIKAGNSSGGFGGYVYLTAGGGSGGNSDDATAGAILLNVSGSGAIRGSTLIGLQIGDNDRTNRLQVGGSARFTGNVTAPNLPAKMLKLTAEGDGTTSTFSIAHDLGYSPQFVVVTPNSYESAFDTETTPGVTMARAFYTVSSSSNIVLNLAYAPASGATLEWTIMIK